MSLRRPSRPFDPTAMMTRNLVIGEVLDRNFDSDPAAIMSHGPFYTSSFVMTSGTKVLTLGVDYVFKLLHRTATEATGKEVACLVQLITKKYSSVSCTYQAVGGQYQDMWEEMTKLIETVKQSPLVPIYVEDIIGMPEVWNTAAHNHHIDEMGDHSDLFTALDDVRNAIEYKQRRYLDEIYSTIGLKLSELEQTAEGKMSDTILKVLMAFADINYPKGMLILSVAEVPDNNFPPGTWLPYNKDTLFYGVKNDEDLGKEYKINDRLTFPLPSDLLLDEFQNPLMHQPGEYIHLDNGFEPDDGAGPLDYVGSIEKIFNSRGVIAYEKTNTTTAITMNSSNDKQNSYLKEGETVVFTLTTTGLGGDVDIDYILTGIGEANVNVPLKGKLRVNDRGVATLAVTLQVNSPRTNMDTMTMTNVYAGLRLDTSCKYILGSNDHESILCQVVSYPYGPVTEKIVRGDQYWLEVISNGLIGKDVLVNLDLAQGEQWSLDGAVVPYNGSKKIKPTASTSYFPIIIEQRAVSTEREITITTKGTRTEGVFKTKLDPFKLLELKFFSVEKLVTVNTVKFSERYQLEVLTNSNSIASLAFSETKNPDKLVVTPPKQTTLFNKGIQLVSPMLRVDNPSVSFSQLEYTVESPYPNQKHNLVRTLNFEKEQIPKGDK